MHQDNDFIWKLDSFFLNSENLDVPLLAKQIYNRTCRINFEVPGFCVLDVGKSIDSIAFRQLMVDIKQEMAAIHKAQANLNLTYLSAGRFDQQESTKLHLDGGPEECFLMLGYEPSEISSQLEIADYAKCAFELDLSPKEFMAKHNPMFQSKTDLLQPYITPISCFLKDNFQIICINNSSAPYSTKIPRWQGTLHRATILNPDESKRRIINSTMIASTPLGSSDLVDSATIENFIHTSQLKRRGYDKLHLQDET